MEGFSLGNNKTEEKIMAIEKIINFIICFFSIITGLIQLLWFPIVINIFGIRWGLVDANGITEIGVTISVILYILTAVILIVNSIILKIKNDNQGYFSSILYKRFRVILDKKEKVCADNTKLIGEKDISSFEIKNSSIQDIFVDWQDIFATLLK